MMDVPRLALATPATGPEPSAMAIALLAGLAGSTRVQHFRTRACPTSTEVVGQLTGLPGRHLDSWLMPPSVCRSLFARGVRGAQLAVVEGTLQPPLAIQSCAQSDLPGDLSLIARALDLPLVAVLSVPGPPDSVLHLPHISEGTDAVLIDRLANPEDLPRLRRLLRLTHGIPVLGALEVMPAARRELERAQRSGYYSDELIHALAHNFQSHADFQAIADLAQSRPFPNVDSLCACGLTTCCQCFRVAYARDEAFGRYFPDTLEALEAMGADLVEFSPLRDERLPEGVDLVLIGCGFPDLHIERLAANLSMTAALRQHVCRGNRIYAEGGGTAYLGRWIRSGGQRFPGVGILPIEAEVVAEHEPPGPVTRTLLHDCWLGTKGTVVRGYKSSRWRLYPSAERLECPSCFGTLTAEGDFHYHHHAVGSMVHLHLGALPEFVAAFANPHRPSLRRPTLYRLPDQP